jgi:hypothetical protein
MMPVTPTNLRAYVAGQLRLLAESLSPQDYSCSVDRILNALVVTAGSEDPAKKVDVAVNAIFGLRQLVRRYEEIISEIEKTRDQLWEEVVRRRIDDGMCFREATTLELVETMKVTEIEAATRQLRTAIWLYFEDRDPVSVHTLAMAALELVSRECKRQGHNDLRNDFVSRIRSERRKEIVGRLHEVRNFFKHGSDSPDVEFDDERNFMALIWATDCLRLLGVDLPEARLFGGWVSVVEPDLILSPPPNDEIARIFGDISSKPRADQKRIGRDALYALVPFGGRDGGAEAA